MISNLAQKYDAAWIAVQQAQQVYNDYIYSIEAKKLKSELDEAIKKYHCIRDSLKQCI